MSTDDVRQHIHDAQASLDLALAALDETPPEPAADAVVSTPEAFDAALAAATPGTVIVCAVSLRYEQALKITPSELTIRSEVIAETRMTADEPCPVFTGGITVTGANVSLAGLEISNTKLVDIVVLAGANPAVYRCRILGNPVGGSKRGIAANAASVIITGCHIDYCHGPYPGNDTQAICAWDTPGPIHIEDNYLCAGSETIMIGGSDPSDEAHLPSDIVIRGNTITKRPEWQTQAINVKNTLELKNAQNVLIEDNDIEYSWGGHGQDGYLLMLTPRNQGGHAPYSTVEDVTIIKNRFAHAAAAINLLGDDNIHPSQRMHRVRIAENTFADLDPKLYTGSNKMIQITRGPVEVAIDANQFHGINIGSVIYFDGSPDCEQLVVTNNQWPPSKYGVFGTGASTGNGANGLPNAWNQYVASGTYAGNVVV